MIIMLKSYYTEFRRENTEFRRGFTMLIAFVNNAKIVISQSFAENSQSFAEVSRCLKLL